jgi:hypothetical protein
VPSATNNTPSRSCPVNIPKPKPQNIKIMGAAVSVNNYTSVEDALRDGQDQETINKYLAELAHNWTPPSTRPQALTLNEKFKVLEAKLATEGWEQADEEEVQAGITAHRAFLNQCKKESVKEIPTLKEVRRKLETKYVGAYNSVSKVLSQDDEAWPKLLALGQQLASEKTCAFCQSRTKVNTFFPRKTERPTFF